MTESYS